MTIVLIIINLVLVVGAFGFSIYGLYVAGLSQLRLLAHIKDEPKDFLHYFLLFNPNNVLLFPSRLDEQGLQYRAKFLRGLRYMFIGAFCGLISYWIGAGWE